MELDDSVAFNGLDFDCHRSVLQSDGQRWLIVRARIASPAYPTLTHDCFQAASRERWGASIAILDKAWRAVTRDLSVEEQRHTME